MSVLFGWHRNDLYCPAMNLQPNEDTLPKPDSACSANAAIPPSRATSGPPERVAFLNQKGGVGKTTTAVNLAAALARSGRRVLLIDLDSQAHATLHLGAEPSESGSIYDVLHDPTVAPSVVLNVEERLDLLPAETDLAAAETELSQVPDRYERLRQAIDLLSDGYDDIMLDCPPSLGLLTLSALAAVEQVIIPMQAHFLSLQGMSKLLETISLIRQKLNPALEVAGVVLCMYDKQATHTQEVVSDIRGFFSTSRSQSVPWQHAQVFTPAIRRNIKLAECPSFGQSIFAYAPSAAGTEDYFQLGKSVLKWYAKRMKRRDSETGSQGAVPVVEFPSMRTPDPAQQ